MIWNTRPNNRPPKSSLRYLQSMAWHLDLAPLSYPPSPAVTSPTRSSRNPHLSTKTRKFLAPLKNPLLTPQKSRAITDEQLLTPPTPITKSKPTTLWLCPITLSPSDLLFNPAYTTLALNSVGNVSGLFFRGFNPPPLSPLQPLKA